MKKSTLPLLLGFSLILLSTKPVQRSQLMSTNLRVTVLDDLGNLQKGAVVVVFATEQDYRFETNPVAGPEETDKRGRVTFKRIAAQSYYIMAVKGAKKNDGKGVKTSKLDAGRMNKINVVIR